MNNLNLNTILNNSNLPKTDINTCPNTDINKKGCLEFDLPVIEDKIVVGNKKFDDIRSAVKYLVKQSNEYAYNIQIKNIAPTPTKIHVVTTFDYEEPRRETITLNILYNGTYKIDSEFFYQLENAVKYKIARSYGKYMDLVIQHVSYWDRHAHVKVSFIDIPDMDEDKKKS